MHAGWLSNVCRNDASDRHLRRCYESGTQCSDCMSHGRSLCWQVCKLHMHVGCRVKSASDAFLPRKATFLSIHHAARYIGHISLHLHMPVDVYMRCLLMQNVPALESIALGLNIPVVLLMS
jgi:hypothetical protein